MQGIFLACKCDKSENYANNEKLFKIKKKN